MRRLIVDAQVFHTPAFHRGMGKYSLELLHSLAQVNEKKKYWDSIELVLSSKMPLHKEVTEVVARMIPSARIVRLRLKKDIIYSAQAIMSYNRTTIDRYIAVQRRSQQSLEIDFLILSPLQGGISCVFPTDPNVHKALIYYDLIPFLFHPMYFPNPIGRIENLTKLTESLKADTFLAISKTVANDLAIHLGVEPKRIHNIDGGPINHSKTAKTLKVPHPFVLMPTGNGLNKNNQAGILGFGEFNKQHDNKYHLVITSFFDSSEVKELSRLAPNIIFTGNISGDELNYLYQECEALLFPSQYEGLGLPVLEAVEKSKPVACSDIAVFREMSKTAFSYFNPSLGASIAEALDRAITKGTKINKLEYDQILKKYSWDRSAQLAARVLIEHTKPAYATPPKVAIFGLNPEVNAPLAKLTQASYAELSRLLMPDYFLEGDSDSTPLRPNLLQFINSTNNITEQVPIDLTPYHVILYNLSNSTNCAKTLFCALANPGIAILHDLDLNKAWQALREEGLIDNSRYELEQELQQTLAVKSSLTMMLCSVLASQKAIAVFSERAKKEVEKLLAAIGTSKPVAVFTLPSAALVYEDTIPEKEKIIISSSTIQDTNASMLFSDIGDEVHHRKIITISGQPTPEGIDSVSVSTDRELEDVISRADFMYCGGDDQILDTLTAMRYGLGVLYYTRTHDSTWSPPGTFIEIHNADQASKTLREFMAHEKKRTELDAKTREEQASHHTYSAYAEGVHTLMRQVLENTK